MFFQDFIGERGMGGLEWRYPIKPKLNNINLIIHYIVSLKGESFSESSLDNLCLEELYN